MPPLQPYKEVTTPWGTYTTLSGIISLGDIHRQSIAIGASSSVSITLDDTDGTLKTVYNNQDLIGQAVTITQRYAAGGAADYIIFEGHIYSDVVWSEIARTLSFEVETVTNSKQVGITPKDTYDAAGAWKPEGWPWAIIDNEKQLYKSNIGKVWPLIYGKVVHSKALQLTKVLSGKLEPLAGAKFITEDTLSFEVTNGHTFEQGVNTLIRVGSVGYSGTFAGNVFTTNVKNGPIQFTPGGVFNSQVAPRVVGDKDEFNPSVCWMETNFHFRRAFIQFDQIVPNPPPFAVPVYPLVAKIRAQEGKKLYFEAPAAVWLTEDHEMIHFSGSLKTGDLPGDVMHVNENAGNLKYIAEDWRIKKGAVVTSLSETIQWHIVDSKPNTLIKSVKAYRVFEGKRILDDVPTSYYVEVPSQDINGILCTCIKMGVALSEILDEGWEDPLFVSAESTDTDYGENVAVAIKNILTLFTGLTPNAASFTAVEALVDDFKMGFVLPVAKDAIKFCEEMAWQARCRLVYIGGEIGIEYLSALPVSSRTIDEDEALIGSLEAGFTSPDGLITNFCATWKEDYSDEGNRNITYNQNIDKYGKITETYNFYIYNQPLLVGKSMSFWGYRLSRLWRRISLNVPITSVRYAITKSYLISITDFSAVPILGDLETIDSVEREVEELGFTMPMVMGEALAQNNDYWLGDPLQPVAAAFTLPDLFQGLKKFDFLVDVGERKQPQIKTIATKNKSGREVQPLDILILNNPTENGGLPAELECVNVSEFTQTADEMVSVDTTSIDGDPMTANLCNNGPFRARYRGGPPVAGEIWGPLPHDYIMDVTQFNGDLIEDVGAIHEEGNAFVVVGSVDTDKMTCQVVRSWRNADDILRFQRNDATTPDVGQPWGSIRILGHGYKLIGVSVRYSSSITFKILRNGTLLHAEVDNLTEADTAKNLTGFPIDIDKDDVLTLSTITNASPAAVDFECMIHMSSHGPFQNNMLDILNLA